MAVQNIPLGVTMNVVLDMGMVSGKQKSKSVSIGSGIKTNAPDAALWAYANGVSGLFEQDPLRFQKTLRSELADN